MRKTITSLILAAALGAGIGGTAVAASRPAEDSKSFNCAFHGNRQCAFKLDTTPNTPGGAKWYIADFKTKTFKLRGF